MPIIDDVLERDRGGMALAVAEASSYGDARTLEFVTVGSLSHDGVAVV